MSQTYSVLNQDANAVWPSQRPTKEIGCQTCRLVVLRSILLGLNPILVSWSIFISF
jgi:hypothetical protein